MLLFACLINSALLSQAVVENNKILLLVNSNKAETKDSKKDRFAVRDYVEYTDPSAPGEFKLPTRNIIVAIPPLSKPNLKVLDYDLRIENSLIPEVNPEVKKIDDSTLVYEPVKIQYDKLNKGKAQLAEIMDYFWFRDFYCAHIKVNTHQFDANRNFLLVYDNIQLTLELPDNYNISSESSLQIKSKFDKEIERIIFNPGIAEQFRSSHKFLQSDTTGSWINYNQNYLKIGTVEDGIYRIEKSDFDNYGINTSIIDPRTIQMFESGKEQKIYIQGEDDGSFDDVDYIEFYGSKNYSKKSHRIINADHEDYNTFLNKYTDTTFYFLTWGGTIGDRIETDTEPISSVQTEMDYYTQLLHFEENKMFQYLNSDNIHNETSNWNKNKTAYWAFIFTGSRNFNIDLEDVYPDKSAKVYFKLSSAGSNITSNAHQIVLKVNNTKIDSQSVDRYKQVLLEGTINSNNLLDGSNTITFTNHDNGTLPNFFGYDWYEIEYPRKLNLIDDKLLLKIPKEFNNRVVEFVIENAFSDFYTILKISEYGKRITNYNVTSGVLTFRDTVKSNGYYAIHTTSNMLKPAFISYKPFTNIREQTTQTDYIAVTHKIFEARIQEYIDQITNTYGLTTKYIFVNDIFDEFGFGYPTAESIKEYVKYAMDNFPFPSPSYLSLIGDATYDYKGYITEHLGVKLSTNLVPAFGYPVSDNWYAVLNDNGPLLPQLKVGRIPARTVQELDYYSNKINHNATREFDELNKRYLLFSGGVVSNPSELRQLKGANDAVITNIISPKPLAANYTHFYKTTDPQSDFGPYSPEEIQGAIDRGGVFISYVGHSGTATWDNSINEVTQLKSIYDGNPLISDFGCSTNKYAEPDIICFGERFLFDPNGQAIGYVGNSSLGFVNTAVNAPKLFYESFVSDSLNEVGAAHIFAKTKLFEMFGNSGTFKTFSLSNVILGDPSVRINIPGKPNLKISSADISFNETELTDDKDSILAKVIFRNFGIANNDEYTIKISHFHEDEEKEKISVVRQLPSFTDSVSVWLKIKSLAGIHKINITLDEQNVIEEIYEEDNMLEYKFNILSKSVKDLFHYNVENTAAKEIFLLNPTQFNDSEINISYEIAPNPDFESPITGSAISDSVYSYIDITNLELNKRYWTRYRTEGNEFGTVKSIYASKEFNYLLNDSISFVNQEMNDLSYMNNTLSIISDSVTISVLSAGFYAGATCVISKDGINLLDNSFFAGMGIVVFDPVTMNVDTSAWFQLFANRPNAEALASMINEIPEGKIVVMGAADDAQHRLIAELRAAIKTLGSTKIDSLVFRGSWAIIGQKGAAPGSVGIIESVEAPFDGSILLSEKYEAQLNNGTLSTNRIGPAFEWDSLFIDYETPEQTSIELSAYGITKSNTKQLLWDSTFNQNSINLSSISSTQYPYLKFNLHLNGTETGLSPSISKFGINYKSPPELAINYQVVSTGQDTITQGDTTSVDFLVYNVGKTPADSFIVTVDLLKPDNTTKRLDQFIVERIDSMGRQRFNVSYPSKFDDGWGNMAFAINVDTKEKIFELYEDNNYFSFPFYVKEDTTVVLVSEASIAVTFDGVDINDGDYINPESQISIALNYPSWFTISDTSSINFSINGNPIVYSTLEIDYDNINRRAQYNYRGNFDDGEYVLRVFGKNVNGQTQSIPSYEKLFLVSNELKLVDAYNYPNPFKDNTNFTFRLTQIPDELYIKVFTVAGRLIREIEVNPSQLKTDFNYIPWDGRDEDGDSIANGVYIYRIYAKTADDSYRITQKLAIMR